MAAGARAATHAGKSNITKRFAANGPFTAHFLNPCPCIVRGV